MSIITSVFHIYGFLITEEAANLILRYTEKVFPDLYKEFSDPEPLLAFQEYLCEKLDGCRYGTAESMTVWRIKDREELDLNPGEEFYIIELKNSLRFWQRLECPRASKPLPFLLFLKGGIDSKIMTFLPLARNFCSQSMVNKKSRSEIRNHRI